MTYHTYSSYCDKLSRRIVNPLLKNYEERNLLTKIMENSKKNDEKRRKTLWKEVGLVRKANMENLS